MSEELAGAWEADLEAFCCSAGSLSEPGLGGGFSATIPEIVTVTFVVQSNQTSLDLPAIHDALKFLAECTASIGPTQEAGVSISLNTNEDNQGTTGKRRLLPTCFYNQISLTAATPEGRRINCKIFQKGKFLVTGCKSVRELGKVLVAISNLVLEACPEALTGIKGFEFLDVKAAMINCCLSLNGPGESVTVMFYELLNAVERLVASGAVAPKAVSTQFDPTVYSGVKMRVGASSIMVFASGKMILSGKGKPSSLLVPLEMITRVLRYGSDKVLKHSKVPRKERKDTLNRKRRRFGTDPTDIQNSDLMLNMKGDNS
jgi:TATA-box binding protein (TBP) (component of TFIID and TFIIIB)